MSRVRSGCLVFAVVTFSSACAQDPVSQNESSASAISTAGASLDSRGGLGGPNDRGPHNYIAILDDCDPDDPTWAPSGGCTRKSGAVTNAEFTAFLASPLSPTTVVGHPSWRNEPSYVKVDAGESVRVTNEGGRTHTFTEVAEYGGGRVPPLRVGLTQAAECPTATNLLPGTTIEIDGLAVGTHKFQCCIHSWMRAAIKVLPDAKGT